MLNSSTIYINLEDDVSAIVTRLKREKATEVTLVCPRRCLLFAEAVNLQLLKKQAELIGKTVSILTMDEKGQGFATAAGFALKVLPKPKAAGGMSDVRISKPEVSPIVLKPTPQPEPSVEKQTSVSRLAQAALSIKSAVKNIASSAPQQTVSETPVMAEEKTVEPEVEAAAVPAFEGAPLLKPAPTSRFQSRVLTGVVVLALIVIILVVFVVLPKAEIVVYARTESLTRDMEVQMATGISEPDPTRLHLPAKKVSKVVEMNASFQSQGKRDVGNKATGTVRIYNFTGAPITLRASTTSLRIGNKAYALSRDVNYLRPTTYKNAATKEINPTSLGEPVEIKASEGGEASNAPAGTRLEITNQVFGSRPTLLYAQADTAIAGGTAKFISFISDQDLVTAQAELARKLVEDYKSSAASDGLVLLDKAFGTDIVSFVPEKPVGTETPSFQASLKMQITALVFDKGQMERLVENRVTQSLSTTKAFRFSASTITYKSGTVDLTNELASLQVHFEGKAIRDVDLKDVNSQLVGKTKEQANEIIRSKADVDKIEMTLGPTWQKSMPWFKQQIEVKIVE